MVQRSKMVMQKYTDRRLLVCSHGNKILAADEIVRGRQKHEDGHEENQEESFQHEESVSHYRPKLWALTANSVGVVCVWNQLTKLQVDVLSGAFQNKSLRSTNMLNRAVELQRKNIQTLQTWYKLIFFTVLGIDFGSDFKGKVWFITSSVLLVIMFHSKSSNLRFEKLRRTCWHRMFLQTSLFLRLQHESKWRGSD